MYRLLFILSLTLLTVGNIFAIRYLIDRNKNVSVHKNPEGAYVVYTPPEQEKPSVLSATIETISDTIGNLIDTARYITLSESEKKIIDATKRLHMDGKMSLYYKDLKTNKEITINADKQWIPASTIKAFLVLEAFHQRDQGRIDFNQVVKIDQQNVVASSHITPEYPVLRSGVEVTIQQLVEMMVIQSDNIAYNQLLDILDRRSVNEYLQSLGITHTNVGQKLNMSEAQLKVDSAVPGFKYVTTTAADYAKMYELLYANAIPNSQEIIEIFKKQKYNDMISRHIPTEIPVAHKTGFWSPYYHDGGIVYYPEKDYILVIMSNMGGTSEVAQLAKVVYESVIQ